jgi:hypothetical protein
MWTQHSSKHLIDTNVRVQKFRYRRSWHLWQFRSPSILEGQSCWDGQRSRRPHPPGMYPLAVTVRRDCRALFTHHGQGSKTTIEGDAKVVAVDYSNKESIKNALIGVDVVICTISGTALNLQAGIAAAAKEAGVKLFVPSEFGNVSEGETEGIFGEKANVHTQLKAVGIPCTVFYTGPFADYLWAPYVFSPRRCGAPVVLNMYLHARFLDLDVPSGKVDSDSEGRNGRAKETGNNQTRSVWSGEARF